MLKIILNDKKNKKYLINYANEIFYKSQKICTEFAYKNGFDFVFELNEKDIDEKFKKINKNILNKKRGAGYWLWKPYLIHKFLKTLNENDFLFYCDSGSHLINNINFMVDVLEKNKQNIMCFDLQYIEKFYTKMDLFIAMNANSENYKESKQRLAGHQLIKKNKFSLQFYSELLKWCQDYHLISDEQSIIKNCPDFKSHRHDQSIFSILTKKYQIPSFRDPSQFGNSYKDIYLNSNYPQMINLHRNKIK